MLKPFSFTLMEAGTPTQHILFRREGEPDQKVPVPGLVLPEEMEPRFRALYKVLVDKKLIEDHTPIFRAG